MAGTYSAQQIAEAIARIESGGNYKAHSSTSSASGKYQYIKRTWNNFGGYAEAWMAPPHVQDAKALLDISAKMKAYGGDVRKVVMSWFLPAAVNNPALAAKVPKGNKISPSQYADRVLKALGLKVAGAPPKGQTLTDTGDVNYTEDFGRPDSYGTIKGQLANLMAAITTPSDRTF